MNIADILRGALIILSAMTIVMCYNGYKSRTLWRRHAVEEKIIQESAAGFGLVIGAFVMSWALNGMFNILSWSPIIPHLL